METNDSVNETLYLLDIKGMKDSIIEKEDEEYFDENDLAWNMNLQGEIKV